MSRGQRSLVASLVITVLLCAFLSIWIPWSTIFKFSLVIIVVAMPIFSWLWTVAEKKWHAYRIVSTYERSRSAPGKVGLPPTTLYKQGYSTQTANTSFPFHIYTPTESGQPKQDRAIDYEQPQAQYPGVPPMA